MCLTHLGLDRRVDLPYDVIHLRFIDFTPFVDIFILTPGGQANGFCTFSRQPTLVKQGFFLKLILGFQYKKAKCFK